MCVCVCVCVQLCLFSQSGVLHDGIFFCCHLCFGGGVGLWLVGLKDCTVWVYTCSPSDRLRLACVYNRVHRRGALLRSNQPKINRRERKRGREVLFDCNVTYQCDIRPCLPLLVILFLHLPKIPITLSLLPTCAIY